MDNKAIKIEETSKKLTLYFKMMEFDLNMTLEKQDNDILKGSLRGCSKRKQLELNE